MTDPRTALVAAGYDAMIDTWEAWKAQIADDSRADWCDELVSRLPRGARVVELGCGGGTDETRMLAERFRLTGVDLSAEQLRRARERVPEAAFVHARHHGARARAGLGRRRGPFYVLNHVPRELLAGPVRSRPPLAGTRRSLPHDARRQRSPRLDGRVARAADPLRGISARGEPAAARGRRARAAARRARHDPGAGGRGDVPLGAGKAMSCGFTLGHYRELLHAARSGGYRFAHFDEPPRRGDLLLRHDVDLSLDAAVQMAELEAEEGVSATYFLMTESVFYNLGVEGGCCGEREAARARSPRRPARRLPRRRPRRALRSGRRLAQPRSRTT